MRTQAGIEGILLNVNAKLDARRRAKGLDLRIPQDGYSLDDGWLTLIVEPTAPCVRAYEYVEALSEVQHELRADGVDHVILVPAFTD